MIGRTRIGIFGGTFDPVHYGHLILAEEAVEQANLDKLYFMPAGIQPFKQDVKIASAKDRLEMLRMATAGNRFFEVTDIETEKPGLSYTIESLESFRRDEALDTDIVFVIGTDMFFNIRKWYRFEDLIRNFGIAVGFRPGYREEELKAFISSLENEYEIKIDCIKNKLIEISSTDIRNRLMAGRSVKYLLPDAVETYIAQGNLYGI